MGRHIGFSVIALGVVCCLFSLPLNSHADPIKQFTNSADHLKGWAMSGHTRHAYGLVGSVNFGSHWEGIPWAGALLPWPGTGVGRSRFGDWKPGPWNANGDDGDADDCPSNSDPTPSTPVSTPEPGAYLLLASGFLSLMVLRRFGPKVVGEL
jgi:hypothetical protein